MNNFFHRIVRFAIRKLNAINDTIEQKKIKQYELNWQSNFIGKNYFDFNFRSNTVLRLYSDSALSKLIFEGFENQELDFVQKFLKPGNTFLDIGANIGMFTVVAANCVGINGKVIAFEPAPLTFERLKQNILLNNFTNVKAFDIGLSDKEDYLNLNISENGFDAWNSFAITEADKLHNKVEVRVRTLDALVADENLDHIDLIKIDVEGWEKYVLYGGKKTLLKQSPIVMIEFTEGNTFAAGYFVQEIFDIMENWGYKWFRYANGYLVPEKKRLHYPYDNLFAVKNSCDSKHLMIEIAE